MSLTISGVVTSTATAVATVSGVGNVHEYRRIMLDEGGSQGVKAVMFHASSGKLACVFCSVESIDQRDGEIGRVRSNVGQLTNLTVVLELFRAVEDAEASEKTFRDVVEAVLRKINSGLIHAESSGQEAASARIGFAFVAGTLLCHSATIRFKVFGRAAF